MRILLIRLLTILPSFSGGGAERVALNILSQLDKHKFDKTLIAISGEGPLKTLQSVDRYIDLKKIQLRSAILPLVRVIWDCHPDIVFSTFGHVNLALLMARPLLPPSTKLILREANLPSLSLQKSRYPKLFSWGYKYLYCHADLLLCSSERMKAEFSHDFKISDDKLSVTPNPVDVEKIRATAMPPIRYPGGGRRFIAAGRLVQQKGFDDLLTMFANLPPQDHLTILGVGPEEKFLRQKAHSLKLPNVSFEGFISEPWSRYAGADAFVLSSRWEGMPNAALEALAVGTPVIATAESGGFSEVQSKTVPAAIRIAGTKDEFQKYMFETDVRSSFTSLEPCLLPPQFWLRRAVSTFETYLTSLVPYT